jgi:murein DD-endopeptidase MepM/ murein hydrolase activator NlpD
MNIFKKFQNWWVKRITLIIAPSRGSRSFHISVSYPFTAFLSLVALFIFTTGLYFSDIYMGYIKAVKTNRQLIEEKNFYSKKVEEALDILQNVKKIEMQVMGMLGMKSLRNIIENYPVGGTETDDKLNLSLELSNLFDRTRFEANVNEVKREAWHQQQGIKNIEGFLAKQRDVLLSTPSIWPVFGYITSGYGWRTHPLTKRREFHRALDIYSPLGRNTPIRATTRGRIILAGWAGSLGRTVIIDHGNGFSTRYCHCSNILVKQRETVEQGQIIAYVGNTGLSTGNHVHYEVWYRGKPVNPVQFVKGR